jgi:hypothetical protein
MSLLKSDAYYAVSAAAQSLIHAMDQLGDVAGTPEVSLKLHEAARVVDALEHWANAWGDAYAVKLTSVRPVAMGEVAHG